MCILHFISSVRSLDTWVLRCIDPNLPKWYPVGPPANESAYFLVSTTVRGTFLDLQELHSQLRVQNSVVFLPRVTAIAGRLEQHVTSSVCWCRYSHSPQSPQAIPAPCPELFSPLEHL